MGVGLTALVINGARPSADTVMSTKIEIVLVFSAFASFDEVSQKLAQLKR